MATNDGIRELNWARGRQPQRYAEFGVGTPLSDPVSYSNYGLFLETKQSSATVGSQWEAAPVPRGR